VGEKISTSRGRPSARLNSDLRVEMAFSAMTPPGCELPAGRAAGADAPGAVDAGDEEQETVRRAQTTAVTAAITARPGRAPLVIGHAPAITRPLSLRMSSMAPGRRAASQINL
jgi:hypothetical protein